MGNSFQRLRNWKMCFEPPRLNFPYGTHRHHTCCLENTPRTDTDWGFFPFCRLMLPLLLLPAPLMIASWSIILLMTRLTSLCLTGKFLTANGINLHQKRFWAIMKSCKFYQCLIERPMFFFHLTFLMCNVDQKDEVNFILIWKMGTKYHFISLELCWRW